MEYDPELFTQSIPCMSAIARTLPADYSLNASQLDDILTKAKYEKSLQL